MEGDKFSWFAKNYLKKRPRYSPTSFPDEQMASTSACMPSTSAPTNRRARLQRILIEPSDEQLLKWQEKQISKCIVDNTLNRVVESYMTFWTEENIGTRNDLEREAQLVSYHANRAQENFEDSAILWAIDQHGLQQHNHTETMSTSSSSISLSSPPHLASHDDLCQFHNTDEFNDGTKSDEVNQTQAQSSQSSNNIENSGTKSDPQSSSGGTSSKEHNEASNELHNFVAGSSNDEHLDFLEAAVSVAIQEKGLNSYSMQKSPKR